MQDGLYVALSAQIALETPARHHRRQRRQCLDRRLSRHRREIRGRRLRHRRRSRFPSPRRATPICPTAHGSMTRDRQPVRLRHPGRCLVRHRDAGRHGDDARRALLHERERPAGVDRGLSGARRRRRADPARPAQRRRPRPAPTASLRQGDQLVGAIGLFNFDPGANFVRYGNSGIVPPGAARAGRRPRRCRRRAGLSRGIQRQSGAGDDPADHGPARLREHRRADARRPSRPLDDAIKTLGSQVAPMSIRPVPDATPETAPSEHRETALGRAGAHLAALRRRPTRCCGAAAASPRSRRRTTRCAACPTIARLGDIVEHRSHAGTRRGEIVKIGRDEVVDRALRAQPPMPASATPCSTAARFTVHAA